MKTIIISSMIVGLLGLNTFNNVYSKDKSTTIYQNVIENKLDKSKTISLYEGKNDMNLKPVKQYIIKYLDENTPIEKITYTWDAKSKSWHKTDKYEYVYSEDGAPQSMIHSLWNESNNSWLVNTNLDILMLDVDKELLTANRNY